MKRQILALALVALMPFSAQADTKDAYSGVGAIPEVLLSKMSFHQRSEQEYVSQVMSVLRTFGRNTTSLDKQDIESAELKQKRDRIKSRLRTVMSYDADFDMKVTKAELLEAKGIYNHRSYRTVTPQEQEREKKQAEARAERLLWEYDADKDGVITAKEVGTLSEGGARNRRERGRTSDAAALLALDPDRDGTLTVPEIEQLARKAWRTVDKDGDGRIDEREKAVFDEVMRKMQMKKSGCVAKTVAAEEKLVLVSVTSGGGIPDVSVAGQEAETGTVRLEIEKGTTPVYLVAVASKPVIWQVTGDTARVSYMVVSAPLERPVRREYGYDYDSEIERARRMQAGVTGLASEKVRFLRGEEGKDCAHYLRLVSQSYIASMSSASRGLKKKFNNAPGLEDIVGRKEDLAAGAYEPAGFRIDADKGKVTTESAAPEGVPEELDAETWERALKFMPGGLVSFRGQEVVSDADAEFYRILPGWAGVAQLVKQGALKAEKPENAATRVIVTGRNMHRMVVRNMASAAVVNDSEASIVVIDESRYRLLREIANFPPGLDGAYGVHFVVPKGVKMPDGKAGTSCVYSEEKDEMTGYGSCY